VIYLWGKKKTEAQGEGGTPQEKEVGFLGGNLQSKKEFLIGPALLGRDLSEKERKRGGALVGSPKKRKNRKKKGTSGRGRRGGR